MTEFKQYIKLPHIIWVVLSEKDRSQLQSKLQFKFDKINLKPDMSLHHITIEYKPKESDIAFIEEWAKENEQIKIEIIENCWDNRIQALRVKLFNSKGKELTIPNKDFHVTVSANTDIPPKTSIDMLSEKHNTEQMSYNAIGVLKYHRF